MKYISLLIIIMLSVLVIMLFTSHHNLQLRFEEYKNQNEPTFIWNDDEESIPADGSLIKLEFTDSTGIYLAPYLDGNTQYIIELVNDSIRVIDPQTERLIYIENFNTNSSLSKAILADNE